jgi:hypothetical protein
MESCPSKIAETLVHWLLPPACREEVLGDMRERSQGTGQLLIETMHTVPSVIYSRVRRTTDAILALMEAVSLYTAFVMSAWWLNRELIFRENGFARLAAPPVIFLATIILADVYGDPKKRSPLRAMFGPSLGFALSYAIELNRAWTLPIPVLAWGGALGALIISTLRVIYPPFSEAPQTAKIPAFWQKLELLPPSFSLKAALVPCVILLAIILYLFISHP